MSSDDKKPTIDKEFLNNYVVQEPKKAIGVVGERIWGPYKTHEGTSNSAKYAGGPWGLGDPDDRSLRVVEKDILIPNVIRKKANTTWCKAANEAFFDCAAEHGMTRMNWKCRTQAKLLRACGLAVMNDQEKIDEVTKEYLDMRAEYRRTGKRKLLQRMG